MKRDFNVWLSGEGDTEEDAELVLQCLDAQHAAEVSVEGRCQPPDWSDFINGDPIRATVRDLVTGEVTSWDVSITTSIDYSAEQVDAAEAPQAAGGGS